MRNGMLALIGSLFFSIVSAQDATVKKLQAESDRSVKKDADTTDWRWKRGGLASLNLTQGSLSNWAAGGDNFSLAVNSQVNYFTFYRKGKHNWDNNIDFNIGFVQTTSLGSRKNDDRVDLLSKYGYKLTDHVFLTGLVNFRTQFFDGYTYEASQPTFSSTILSPAYALVSAGFDYKRDQHFSAFLSPITSRWVIVANSFLADRGLYGVPAGKHSAYEMGAFATINYARPFPKHVTYKARLDLFSNYLRNPGNIDVYMTHMLSLKINDWLSATYNLDMIYDDDVKLFKDTQSPATQLKSTIGIGILKRLN
jgi:hypothetical protein